MLLVSDPTSQCRMDHMCLSKRSVPCLTERNLSDVEYLALRDTTGIIAIIVMIGTRSEHLTNPCNLFSYKNYIVGATSSSSRGQCSLRS
jgi:hypothetical protein